jgi:hypothetical protein
MLLDINSGVVRRTTLWSVDRQRRHRAGDLVHYFDGVWVLKLGGLERIIVYQDLRDPADFRVLGHYRNDGLAHNSYRGHLDRLESRWWGYKVRTGRA